MKSKCCDSECIPMGNVTTYYVCKKCSHVCDSSYLLDNKLKNKRTNYNNIDELYDQMDI